MKTPRLLVALFLATTLFACGGGSESTLTNQEPDPIPQPDQNLIAFYQDADGDGFGNPAVTQSASSQPIGYVADKSDCDDQNAKVNPANTTAENVNPWLDSNCDGTYWWLPQNGKKNNLTIERSWNENTRQIIEKYFKPGNTNPYETKEFNYDGEGNLVSEKTRNGDEKGKVLYSKVHHSNTQGHLLYTLSYNQGDIDQSISAATEYSYDEQGRRKTYLLHAQGGFDTPVTLSFEYSYNEQGNTAGFTFHNQGGLDTPVLTNPSYEYYYDSEGRWTSRFMRMSQDLGANIASAVEQSFDTQGNLVTRKSYPDGDFGSPVKRYEKHSYDEQNRLVEYTSLTPSFETSVLIQHSNFVAIKTPLRSIPGVYHSRNDE